MSSDGDYKATSNFSLSTSGPETRQARKRKHDASNTASRKKPLRLFCVRKPEDNPLQDTPRTTPELSSPGISKVANKPLIDAVGASAEGQDRGQTGAASTAGAGCSSSSISIRERWGSLRMQTNVGPSRDAVMSDNTAVGEILPAVTEHEEPDAVQKKINASGSSSMAHQGAPPPG